MKKALGYITSVCLLISVISAQTQTPCPPCYNDNPILPGQGDATSDGRLILRVYVEPQGWDSTAIYQRMVDAADRSMTGTYGWDNAKGSNINTTIPYYLQRTDDPSKADITIKRGQEPNFGCAGGNWNADDTKFTVNMDTATQNLSDNDLRLMIEHE